MGLLPIKWEPDFEFANKDQVRRRGIAGTTRVYRYMSAARLLRDELLPSHIGRHDEERRQAA